MREDKIALIAVPIEAIITLTLKNILTSLIHLHQWFLLLILVIANNPMEVVVKPHLS